MQFVPRLINTYQSRFETVKIYIRAVIIDEQNTMSVLTE